MRSPFNDPTRQPTMTVKELMEKLSKVDPNSMVCWANFDYDQIEVIQSVMQIKGWKSGEKEEFLVALTPHDPNEVDFTSENCFLL